ncbi:hypothetical protein ACFL1B_02160 [Nanoarchaeota archaeon]
MATNKNLEGKLGLVPTPSVDTRLGFVDTESEPADSSGWEIYHAMAKTVQEQLGISERWVTLLGNIMRGRPDDMAKVYWRPAAYIRAVAGDADEGAFFRDAMRCYTEALNKVYESGQNPQVFAEKFIPAFTQLEDIKDARDFWTALDRVVEEAPEDAVNMGYWAGSAQAMESSEITKVNQVITYRPVKPDPSTSTLPKSGDPPSTPPPFTGAC